MFGIHDFAAFCLAILVFLALPGPGTLALLNSTAKGGFVAGAAATLGLILGDQVLLWMAVGGVAALLAAYPTLLQAIQLLGASYLTWIGLRLLFAPQGAASPVPIEPHHYGRQAFLITLFNPKAIVFYMAFFPLFIEPEQHQGLITFSVMAITIATITAAYCLTLCAFAHALTDRIRRHGRLTWVLEKAAGLFLIGFGIRLLRS